MFFTLERDFISLIHALHHQNIQMITKIDNGTVIRMNLGLDGKHVLITGASGGIGLATARLFLEEDAKVTAHYNTNSKTVEELKELHSGRVFGIKADLRDASQVEAMFRRSMDHFGRIDVLVVNAGVWPENDTFVADMSLKQWENTLAINLTGAFLCCKYFFQNLREHQGEHASVIFVGSTAGVFGEAGHCDYSATKAAMKGLTLSLKNEIVHFARKGRVNLVNPGWTITPMAETSLSDEQLVKRVLQTIPLRKVATAEDIANIIVFLASDKVAGHISGQSITVAGGMEGRVLFTPEQIDLSEIK